MRECKELQCSPTIIRSIDNVLHKTKYGIYVKPGFVNNTFIANDFQGNEISANDQGSNHWNGSLKATGLQSLMELF
jgi:hypothetical protein